MAFFKFRKTGDDAGPSTRQPESIEALRRRARHRLVGAVVLVVAGVIGFPLLFDTQPRPVAVDIPIDIPDRSKVKPLPLPRAESQGVVTPAPAPQPAPPAVAVAVPEAAAPKPQDEPEPTAVPEPAPPVAKSEPRPEPKPLHKAETPRTQAASDRTAAPGSDDGAKARALLDGKPPADGSPPAADGRFVVQVGAFADPSKARETRLRVEKAGLKTYTNIAETRDGKRIRVRVGPFANRSEADRAAQKIKGLELPAVILTL
jgi:DedD protein